MKQDPDDRNIAADQRPHPSQAEGERDPGRTEPTGRPVPSQAEGDEETVEENISSKR